MPAPLRSVATFLGLFGLLTCSFAQSQGRIETHEFAQPDRIALTRDLHRPAEAESPRPVILFVHGGGWKNGDKTVGEKQAAWLTDHGFAVASIDFRQTDAAPWPAQINDCYAAVRWLRENEDRLGLATEKIGAMGTSSGGHLVALMGTRVFGGSESTSSRVQAVCDVFGPTNLLTMPPNNVGNGRTAEDVANSNGAKLLGATVREVPDLAKDASALYQVSRDDAAFLILHGDADEGVPVDQSKHLYAALIAAEVDAELIVLPGARHGGPPFETPELRAKIASFFDRTLR